MIKRTLFAGFHSGVSYRLVRGFTSSKNSVATTLDHERFGQILEHIDNSTKPRPASSLAEYNSYNTKDGRFKQVCNSVLTAIKKKEFNDLKNKALVLSLIAQYVTNKPSLPSAGVFIKQCLDKMDDQTNIDVINKCIDNGWGDDILNLVSSDKVKNDSDLKNGTMK